MNDTMDIPAQYTDVAVIQEVLLGNIALFEMLIRRYNALLYKTGRAYGFNHQDTEDLMQETYINAYQHLNKLENKAAFKTWIIKIMLHQCYHKVRKQSYQHEKWSNVAVNNKTDFMDLPNTNQDTSTVFLKKEFAHVIENAVQQLPEDYRITFALRVLAGLSVADTAALMNTTAVNVKVRLSRARLMLRKAIEQLYSPEDVYEFNLIYCNSIVAAVMSKLQNLAIEP